MWILRRNTLRCVSHPPNAGLSRNSLVGFPPRALLFESEIRANYPDRSLIGGSQPRSPYAATESQGVADPLQRISCSSRRYIATSASQGGERRNGKGGTTSGGESQSIPRRATEGTSREQGGKEKEEKYTREKGMRSRREPERGGHERGREKATKEGKADAWESSALRRGGAQPGTGERKSRELRGSRLSSSSASSISPWEIRSPRDAFYRLPMLILVRARFSAMDLPVDFSPPFLSPFFLATRYTRAFLSDVEREMEERFRERFTLVEGSF